MNLESARYGALCLALAEVLALNGCGDDGDGNGTGGGAGSGGAAVAGATGRAGNEAQAGSGNGGDAGAPMNEGGSSGGGFGSSPQLTPGPSCVGLANDCGPDRSESCCEALLVPGGTFDRSNDPAFPATVRKFGLDRFEVTVGRFRKFVEGYPLNKPAAGSGANPNNPNDEGWSYSAVPGDQADLIAQLNCDAVGQTWRDHVDESESFAVNCVSWYTAFAFCIWDGGRLPTEAEWNYAAAGGDEQRPYPWSSSPSDETIDDARAVYDHSRVDFVGSMSPAGDGRWGHADLAGNVAEWVLDIYGDYPVPCSDCAGIDVDAISRMHRGGSFVDEADRLLTSERHSFNSLNVASDNGFRCARDF
jgi:formylglycine-generating enzyme